MGSCHCTESRDCTALLKMGFIFILSQVMLIIYSSAYVICEEIEWSDLEDETYNDFKNSECRFAFFDKTFVFNSWKVFKGDVYVVSYMALWCGMIIVSLLAFLVLACKCCMFLRRFLSLTLLAGAVALAIADIVSISTTYKHYTDAMETPNISAEMKEALVNYRNCMVGMNFAMIVMLTYILLNAAVDLADSSDHEEEDKGTRISEQEMVQANQGVRA